jgi:hypothetical protein
MNGAVGNAHSSLPWRLQLLRLRWSAADYASLIRPTGSEIQNSGAQRFANLAVPARVSVPS